MNLFNNPDTAKAELVLAALWAKAAKSEGHRKRFPQIKSYTQITVKPLAEVRSFAARHTGTFTLDTIDAALPHLTRSQICTALSSATSEGSVVVVGKSVNKLNIYRGAQA